MEDWENEFLDELLGHWADNQRNDFGELRSTLWYPSESIGARKNLARSDADQEDSRIYRVIQIITGVVDSLIDSQRCALRQSLGLRNVDDLDEYENRVNEARNLVWRALCRNGCGKY